MITTDQWITITETESTNKLLLEGDYPSGTMVTARRQTKGRGRQGKTWNNTWARSFLFSLVLEFDEVPKAATAMPLIAGLCVLEAASACLKDLYPAAASQATFSFKWPNDVLVRRGDVTGKLAGILLESKIENGKFRLVTGVGLNWSAVPSKVADAAFQPVALFQDDFPQAEEPEQFTGWLISAFNKYHYDQPAFTAQIKESILDRFYLKGKLLSGPFGRAKFEDLADDGALLLRADDGNIIRYDRTDHELQIEGNATSL